MEKAFREKKCISSKFELARFHQGTDDIDIANSKEKPIAYIKFGASIIIFETTGRTLVTILKQAYPNAYNETINDQILTLEGLNALLIH